MGDGITDISAERKRQLVHEAWSEAHDDEHTDESLAVAAACYTMHPHEIVPSWWPWESIWFKPRSRRENLVRAGALIAAEIDRLDRANPAFACEACSDTGFVAKDDENLGTLVCGFCTARLDRDNDK